MNSLTKVEFKASYMQPIIDVWTDVLYQLYLAMEKSVPADLPFEQRKQMLSIIMKGQTDSIVESIKAVNPSDLEAKLKEQVCQMNS